MRLKIVGLVGSVLITLSHAGNSGWESTTCSPVTEYTTVYSVDTSYVETTVYSTATEYSTVIDTTTEIQVQPTTLVDTTTSVQAVPTTIVNEHTVTSVDLSTVTTTTTTTVVQTTTVTTCPPTTTLTGLVTCTSRIVNPTYTPKAPLPSDYLWGCPPGTICTPPQIDCNWEQNPPADTYVCAPDECQPLPDLPSVDFNATWPSPTEADCAWYEPTLGYFHLNPEHFGLTFAIFDVYGQPICPSEPSPTTGGWDDWASPTPKSTYMPRRRRETNNPLAEIRRRQSLAIAPAPCYSVYDHTSEAGQNAGYVYDLLCLPTTDFQTGVAACRACAATYAGSSTSTDSFPDIQVYESWCLANAP
ncbi:uncharacterized protein Z518_08872 [Rhinocladiella mackenziei CBS 650.93]|uniref:Uncharacterized protein n=1 Tax=Rhinocladiella mackenziei CBS 650.93 TaxID=1442369 RepID=A0A0D2IAS0_9EURO|nr:uncharacterized protein Z518_08872 [Rhinocladiella mackenziei CBS 650.93]KIX02929.1 hypothetical protein Z518_08872 [Rhinocladiella mackenziei CBS 650.93]